MKKRVWKGAALLIALSMLAACGKGEAEKPTESAESKGEESAAQEPGEPFADRKKLEFEHFTLYYPEKWKLDEDSTEEDESYAKASLYLGETPDDSDTNVLITASEQSSYSFRKDVCRYGIDLREYAEGKAEKRSFGDLELTICPGWSEDSSTLFCRDEASATTVDVEVEGDVGGEEVREVLEGLVLTLKDEGEKDAPYPWEGEPYTPEIKPQMVGSYTIDAEYIPFEEPYTSFDIMEYRFDTVGDQLCLLHEKQLSYFTLQGDKLVKGKELELERDCDDISSDHSGMLYLSPGIGDVMGVKDGVMTFQSTVDGYLHMHPSGEWGISYWVGSDTQKIRNQGGNLVSEPWILTNMSDAAARQGIFSMVDSVAISDSRIMVSGNAELEGGEEDKRLVVYDYDGNTQLEFGGREGNDPDMIGYITAMVETENGYIATDGNMRDIFFWSKDGTYVGTVDVKEFLGTRYPWIEDMRMAEDGSVLLLMTQERDDESASELMVFRMSGF